MHSTHAHRLPLGTSKNIDFGSYKLWLDFSRFLTHAPPKGGPDQYHGNLTNTAKPL